MTALLTTGEKSSPTGPCQPNLCCGQQSKVTPKVRFSCNCCTNGYARNASWVWINWQVEHNRCRLDNFVSITTDMTKEGFKKAYLGTLSRRARRCTCTIWHFHQFSLCDILYIKRALLYILEKNSSNFHFSEIFAIQVFKQYLNYGSDPPPLIIDFYCRLSLIYENKLGLSWAKLSLNWD